jgi:hypothetical protein
VACAFAGIIMAHMTTMVTASGVVYGDGTDIGVHLVMVVMGPICAFAVVRAVPAILSQLLQSMSGGGGSSFAAGAAAAMVVARGSGGVGAAMATTAWAPAEGASGGLDAAIERGRADAALAAFARLGGPPPGAGSDAATQPANPGSQSAADQIRGEP